MIAKNWCPNSGGYASLIEREIPAADGDPVPDNAHAKCGYCGRTLKLRKNSVLPHHHVTPRQGRAP